MRCLVSLKEKYLHWKNVAVLQIEPRLNEKNCFNHALKG